LTEYLGVGAESRVWELGSIIGTGEAEGDTSPLNPQNKVKNMEGLEERAHFLVAISKVKKLLIT
jgi:hypothetical protein